MNTKSKTYILFIFYFLFSGHFIAQKVSFVNELGNRLKNRRVLIITGSKTDTLYTNKLGNIDLKANKNFDSISFPHNDKTISKNKFEINQNKNLFIVEISSKSLPVFEAEINKNSQLPNSMSELNHQVISSKEVYNSNTSSGAELLLLADEVTIQKSSFAGGSPIIRGFEANRILLMIDGIRMNNAIYRSGHLQNSITVDPFIVENCNIIFGPSAVSYGSDAIGGVIDYKTKDPITFSKNDSSIFKGNYFIRFNSATQEITNHINFNISGKNIASLTSVTYKKFGDVSMGQNRNHGFDEWGKHTFYVESRNLQDTVINNPNPFIQKGVGYDQIDLTNKILFTPTSKSRVIINSQFSKSSNLARFDQLNNYDLNGAPEYSQWDYGPQKRILNSISITTRNRSIFFDEVYAVFSHQYIEESRVTRKFKSLIQRNMIEKVNVLGGNIQLSKSLSSSAQITYGTELYYNSVQSDAYSINLSDFIVSTNNSRYPSRGSNIFFPALYGNYNIKKNRFSIMAGVRYTWNHIYASYGDNSLEFLSGSLEIKKHSINGSFNTIFYPNKNTKFFLDLSTGFRSPNIDDLGKVFIKDEFLTVPNNDLIPEYAYNLSLGLRSQKELNKYKFSFSASSFATLLDNVITKQSFEIEGDNVINYEGGSYELLANQNAKSALVYGASGSFGFNFKKFNFHSSICYTKGEITKSQLSMSHIPPVFGKINFKYSFKKVDLHILNVFNSNKTLESFGDGNTDNQAEATKEGYPKWWIVNTKATYYLKKLIILNMGVYNLFDIHYKTFSSGISAPGRSLMISAKLTF